MSCNPADKTVLTYGAQAPSIKWSLSAGRNCLGIWRELYILKPQCWLFHWKQPVAVYKELQLIPLMFDIFKVVIDHFNEASRWIFSFCFLSFVLVKQGNLGSVFSSSNSITLLKLISLVNICPCPGPQGLIRQGTWRPRGLHTHFLSEDTDELKVAFSSSFNFFLSVLVCDKLRSF